MAEKVFSGRTFKTEQVLATRLIILQAKFFRIAGPAIDRLGDIMAGYGKGATEADKTYANTVAVKAFSSIFAASPPEDVAEFIKEIAEMASLKRPSGNYDQVDFDVDFMEHAKDILPVVVWVAQEQFGDFLSGLMGLADLAEKRRS